METSLDVIRSGPPVLPTLEAGLARLKIEEALRNRRVEIDAAVAQKRPIAADILKVLEVDLPDQDVFSIVRGLGKDAAEGIGQERASPKLEAGAFRPVAPDVSVFLPHAVDSGYVDAVGDGVASLNGLPRLILRRAVLLLLRGVPADGGGIEEEIGALERGDAGAFRVPLVPADQCADAADRWCRRRESQGRRG